MSPQPSSDPLGIKTVYNVVRNKSLPLLLALVLGVIAAFWINHLFIKGTGAMYEQEVLMRESHFENEILTYAARDLKVLIEKKDTTLSTSLRELSSIKWQYEPGTLVSFRISSRDSQAIQNAATEMLDFFSQHPAHKNIATHRRSYIEQQQSAFQAEIDRLNEVTIADSCSRTTVTVKKSELERKIRWLENKLNWLEPEIVHVSKIAKDTLSPPTFRVFFVIILFFLIAGYIVAWNRYRKDLRG